MEVDQRISNNYRNFASAKLGDKMDEDEGENKRIGGAVADLGGGVARLYGWPSSRIVRVSRASGGKDRHSKVLTSKGLRDRRVRLSVNTAIQFYDLQDRLGYDQPSKAVEWLLAAAASAIDELPPIDTDFLNAPRVCNDRISCNLQRELAIKSSPGSSNSETSKGSSGISVSRSESRMKDKKESDSSSNCYVSSFTELLSGRNNNNCVVNNGPDYFTSGLFGPPPAQMFSVTAEQHHHHPPELQPFSFVNPSAVNRGTLQSNSPFPPPPSFFSGAATDSHHHFVNGFHYGRNSDQKEKENN